MILRYLRETLHGSNKKNDIFNKVRDSHPELPKVICVLWDSILARRKQNVMIHKAMLDDLNRF